MRLTRQYRVITAAFDMELEYNRPLAESFQPGSGEWDTAFWVGSFEYEVIFRKQMSKEDYMEGKDLEDTNEYEVLFKISDFKFSSDEEMIQVLSKIVGRPIKTVQEAKTILAHFDKYGLTNLGNSRPIIAGVLGAIKQFVSQTKPDCLVFNAYEPKRREFYSFLVGRLSKSMGFSHSAQDKTNSKQFKVCLNPTG